MRVGGCPYLGLKGNRRGGVGLTAAAAIVENVADRQVALLYIAAFGVEGAPFKFL